MHVHAPGEMLDDKHGVGAVCLHTGQLPASVHKQSMYNVKPLQKKVCWDFWGCDC